MKTRLEFLKPWLDKEIKDYINLYEKDNKKRLESFYLAEGIPADSPEKRVKILANKLQPLGYTICDRDTIHITAEQEGKPKALILLEEIVLTHF